MSPAATALVHSVVSTLGIKLNRIGARFPGCRYDRVVISVLFLSTVSSALSLPLNSYPKDNWFGTQYLLFGRFPLTDDYPPIAVPAVFYKLVHWLALLLGTDLRGELYLASIAQNAINAMQQTKRVVYPRCFPPTKFPRTPAYCSFNRPDLRLGPSKSIHKRSSQRFTAEQPLRSIVAPSIHPSSRDEVSMIANLTGPATK